MYSVGKYNVYLFSPRNGKKCSVNLTFLSVSKVRTNKLYIFWHCTCIVYIYFEMAFQGYSCLYFFFKMENRCLTFSLPAIGIYLNNVTSLTLQITATPETFAGEVAILTSTSIIFLWYFFSLFAVLYLFTPIFSRFHECYLDFAWSLDSVVYWIIPLPCAFDTLLPIFRYIGFMLSNIIFHVICECFIHSFSS